MASTYSPNLALELIGTGDQAGTWGNTTNTNLGTLIEQAISGYDVQTLTSGTTLTLTIPNGSTGVARNMYLEFDGTGSTVIVPSNKKLYFVYNNCTSGTITFKVAGQTGVDIEKGDKVILVSDGTDIVEAVSPSIGTPATTTSNAVVLWDGTDGTAIKNSSVTVNSSGNITTSGDALINNVYIGRRTSEIGGGPDQNLIIGQSTAISLLSLGTQNLNTIVGNNAGNGLTGASSTGNFNTMFGYGAAQNGGNNSFNTYIGYATGSNVNSTQNVAVGSGAQQGGAGSNGGFNVAVGYDALNIVTSGETNTAVGHSALDLLTTANNCAGLGYNAQVTGSNQIQLGDSATTTYAYGAVQDRSDARDKTEIRDTQLGLNFIMALRPRDFKWDMREDYRPPAPPPDATEEEKYAYAEACKLSNLTHDGTHTRTRYHQGLIAQEVKQTMDELGVDFGGYQDHSIKGGDAVLTIGYEELVAPLIKAIQELKAEFDEYKSTHP
jgi:hypothetical protein